MPRHSGESRNPVSLMKNALEAGLRWHDGQPPPSPDINSVYLLVE